VSEGVQECCVVWCCVAHYFAHFAFHGGNTSSLSDHIR
jgi:hypothetical protein